MSEALSSDLTLKIFKVLPAFARDSQRLSSSRHAIKLEEYRLRRADAAAELSIARWKQKGS